MRLTEAQKNWTFTSSAGDTGVKTLHGKPAKWMDFSGPATAGKKAGVTILDHPSNLRHPAPWYVNQQMPYFSPAILFDKPYTLPAHAELALKYRVLIHDGTLDKTALDRLWGDFSKQ